MNSNSLRVHGLSLGMARGYLIECTSGMFLVDAGSPGSHPNVLRQMQALGRQDLRSIFITHAHLDHYGSAAELRRLTGARIAIHRADAQTMASGTSPLGSVRGKGRLVKSLLPLLESLWKLEPIEADLILEDGDRLDDLGLPAMLIHTPGHTPGSSSLLVQDHLAFVGDLLSTNGRPHVQRYYAHDWEAIPRSLARLCSFSPQTIFPGHGKQPLDGEKLAGLVKEGKDSPFALDP